jgi:hypothetical protein
MTAVAFDRLRDIIQEDVANRGLRAEPDHNLVTETVDDLREACQSLASEPAPDLVIVTGFFIPTADPPAPETDGPLGAIFLARALVPVGATVAVAAEADCIRALEAGLDACALRGRVRLVTLPSHAEAQGMAESAYFRAVLGPSAGLHPTHLLAIERVGPNHTLDSLSAQRRPEMQFHETHQLFEADLPEERRDRCHTARGIDITDRTSPAHLLFEAANRGRGITTIGIGDGGNELGMGSIGWEVIRRNIPRGGLVACRVPVDHLIVCGVSNWGAYALAAGVYGLREVPPPPTLFDPDEERQILVAMVHHGPLVDGVRGCQSATVDGLSWEQYAKVLPQLREAIEVG